MTPTITRGVKRQIDRTADREAKVAKKKSNAGRKKSKHDLVPLNVNVPNAIKIAIVSLAGAAKRTISGEVWLALEKHIERETGRPLTPPQGP